MRENLDLARHQMEHAVLLPENDPRRVAASADAQRTEVRARLWDAVLAEHRDLEDRLRDVPLPDGLVDRLRRIPSESSRPRRERRWLRVMSLAAVLAFTIGVGWYFSAGIGDGPDQPIETLAMLAALDHSSDPTLTVRTDDLSVLSSTLAKSAPFEIAIRPPVSGAMLDGGRLCSFGDRPIVYTRWRTASGGLALYQMEHRTFGIRPGLPPVDINAPKDGSPNSRCRVRVWSDNRFAYVVVDDRRNHDPGG